jgi:hypothetical protein
MGTSADPGAGRLVAPGHGPGWAKLAEAVAARVPPREIERLHVFRPFKRDGREWGTAVVTSRAPDGRLRVFTAKYMLVVRGKDRGRARLEVDEVGLSPAEVLEQVMRATAERSGEATPPDVVSPGVWYEG